LDGACGIDGNGWKTIGMDGEVGHHHSPPAPAGAKLARANMTHTPGGRDPSRWRPTHCRRRWSLSSPHEAPTTPSQSGHGDLARGLTQDREFDPAVSALFFQQIETQLIRRVRVDPQSCEVRPHLRPSRCGAQHWPRQCSYLDQSRGNGHDAKPTRQSVGSPAQKGPVGPAAWLPVPTLPVEVQLGNLSPRNKDRLRRSGKFTAMGCPGGTWNKANFGP
jgi:hypothetical protein